MLIFDHRSVLKFILYCLVCSSIFMSSGCRFPIRQTKVEPGPSTEDLKLYHQALEAYDQSAYAEAAKAFEAVRSHTRDERFRQMALYGLACARLLEAQTPREYNQAILLWEQWVKDAPSKFDYENPVMVDNLIKEKMLFSNIPLGLSQSQSVEDGPMVSQWLLIKSRKELDRLRNELKKAQQEVDKQKRLVQTRDNTISELKRKIRALETIDQKIQKKKNAIPSAETVTPR